MRTINVGCVDPIFDSRLAAHHIKSSLMSGVELGDVDPESLQTFPLTLQSSLVDMLEAFADQSGCTIEHYTARIFAGTRLGFNLDRNDHSDFDMETPLSLDLMHLVHAHQPNIFSPSTVL